MSTELLIGILILLLVVGVPMVQAIVRSLQRRRSLGVDGVSELRDLGLQRDELPRGLSLQSAEAVTSEELALADDNPEATIAQLDESGRVIGYRESFRDPRSMGEFLDWVCGQTVYHNRAHRRIELELTRYESDEHASQALAEKPRLDPSESEVSVDELDERGGLMAREWRRSENGADVQRMLELRWASGDVLGVIRGDSEPAGALDDSEVERLASLVRSRLT